MAVRFLAIDLGDKRTGIAVGDSVTALALPVDVLEVPVTANGGRDLLAAIGALVKDHGPSALVVGLPLNMDGSEGQRAKLVRDWATRIGAATGLPIHLQDERLTSSQADWLMARSGMTHGQKKAKRDAIAAAAILKDFLAANSGEPGPNGPA
jgi:putative Holliday junction resolvase